MANIELTNLAINGLAFVNANGTLNSLVLGAGDIAVGTTSGPPVSVQIQGTPNEVVVTSTSGNIVISAPQPIGPSSNVTFNSLTLTGVGPNATLFTNSQSVVSGVVLGNGEILVGSANAPPVATTLTGTAHEVIITNAAGSVTFSTPQPIDTTSNVQFNALKLGGATIGGAYIDASNNLASTSMTDGQVLIGTGIGTAPLAGNILGTANQISVLNGAGSIQLTLPQNINTSSTPLFAGVSISAFAGGFLLQSTGHAITESTITPGSVITTGTALGGALTGFLPDPSLVTQAGVVPGSYGNLTCIPQINVVGAGIITGVSCINIAGFYELASVNSTFVGTPNEIYINQPNNATLVFSTPQPIATTSQVPPTSIAPHTRE